MGELVILEKRRGRPRLSPPTVHSNSLCDCGNRKPPLSRSCTECSWFDPAIFDRLDRLTRTGRQQRRRAEYLIENGKEELLEREFRR